MQAYRSIFINALFSLIFAASASAATGDAPSQPLAQPVKEHTSLDGITIQGTVSETMNAGGYTYLLVDAPQGKTWVAIPETEVNIGQAVTCSPGMTMKNFASKTLNRTFESIVFSPGIDKDDLEGAAVINDAVQEDKNVPPANGGTASFTQALKGEQASGKESMPPAGGAASMEKSTGSAGAIVPSADVNVNKATGENSFSVGECFAQAKELNTHPVKVRGKVMKISRMIMGKNWLHIQDGTGDPAKNQHDLVVTTTDDPGENTVVTVEGVLNANRDFGAGYKYEVIIENAKVEK